MVSFELGDFLIESFYLSRDELPNLFAFFAIVDAFLSVLDSDVINEFVLVVFKALFDHLIELFFAVRQLLTNILWQSLDVTAQLHLPKTTTTFLRSNSSNRTIQE